MSRVVRTFAVVVALPLLAASPATGPSRRSQVEAWLGDLVHRDAIVRDAARIELMGLSFADLTLLQSCVVAKRPKPAQADVLREVVVHVLTREAVRSMPTSGLPYIGVSHAPADDPVQVTAAGEPMPEIGSEVVEVLPGSPAAATLQVGDVILGIDIPNRGTAWITQVAQLGQSVMACPVGDAMTLLVRRAGRVFRVTLTPEPRPLPLGGMMEDAIIIADNAQVDANRVFDHDWATLPGLSP